MKGINAQDMTSPSKIRISLYRGLIGLAIGCVSGGILGASVMWFISWLRENPDEPAWIFAGTMVGLMFGIVGGSLLGLIIGLFSAHNVGSRAPMLSPSLH
ncbi:MAG: hypothetical protein M3410_16740 [Acidobacteriota bacterium]|nr:hypothetical protein [Acidobacteriota bacterium]